MVAGIAPIGLARMNSINEWDLAFGLLEVQKSKFVSSLSLP